MASCIRKFGIQGSSTGVILGTRVLLRAQGVTTPLTELGTPGHRAVKVQGSTHKALSGTQPKSFEVYQICWVENPFRLFVQDSAPVFLHRIVCPRRSDIQTLKPPSPAQNPKI